MTKQLQLKAGLEESRRQVTEILQGTHSAEELCEIVAAIPKSALKPFFVSCLNLAEVERQRALARVGNPKFVTWPRLEKLMLLLQIADDIVTDRWEDANPSAKRSPPLIREGVGAAVDTLKEELAECYLDVSPNEVALRGTPRMGPGMFNTRTLAPSCNIPRPAELTQEKMDEIDRDPIGDAL